jgi:Uma2 family endonuclease
MSTVATKPMTAEEFFDWVHRPENRDRHFELEEGEIVEMPLPGERHGVVCGNVAYHLGAYVRKRKKGYICTNDTGLILKRGPDTVRGADVVLYAQTKKYSDLKAKYSDQMPALVVEVFSPTDRLGKMLARIDQFLARGVPMVWLLFPERQTLTIFRPEEKPLDLDADEDLAHLKGLPGFRCKVAEFFAIAE